MRPDDPFPPLPGVRKPRFAAEVDEVRRLARLGLPDRAYLTAQRDRHAAEWRATAGEDDPTIDFLVGVCNDEGIGTPADPVEACRRFDVAVRLGSTAAMVRLGGAYATGDGVPRDPATAVLLYRRAAEGGDVDGTTCLAAAFVAGAGVSRDPAEAVRLFQLAADRGSPVGDLGLAAAFRLGVGTKEDAAASMAHMRRALDARSALAMLSLGDGYSRGLEGFDHDLPTGAIWYRRAADLGSPEAMLRLADLCISDPAVHSTPDDPTSQPTAGGGPDGAGAVAWIRRAARTGDPAGLLREGDLLATGMSPALRADAGAALGDYHRSIDAGGTAAFGRLGHMYQVGWHVDRNPTTARELYRRGADVGDADCMAALAATYDESFAGLDHDAGLEAFWYQRAASADNVAGMLGLAECYLNGRGVQRDLPLAATWYGKATDAGSAAGMNGLGLVNDRQQSAGLGSGRNPAAAASWFRRAAERGDGNGMRNLARAYAAGNGVPADGPQAVTLLERSVRTFQAQGDPRRAAEVMLDLANLYASGLAVPRDMRASLDWANRSAAAGNAAAWTFMGNVSERGYGGVPRDATAALVAYRKGATGGDVPAMLAAGSMRQRGLGGPVDEREAFAWYTRAANAGSAEGMDRLGLLYSKATQAAHNLPVAANWFEQAAAAGSALGAGHLAEMRAKGLGGPVDLPAARQYAEQAADGRHPEFLTIVADVYLRGVGGEKPDRAAGEMLLRMAVACGDPTAAKILEQLPPISPTSRPVGQR